MTLRASPAMKLAHAENLAAGAVDRRRSHEKREARLNQIRSMAERAITVPFAANDEAVQFLRFTVIEASRRLSAISHPGQVENLHAALSRREPAPAVDHKARAAAEWLKVAANDGGQE